MDSDAEGIPSEFFDYFKVVITLSTVSIQLHRFGSSISWLIDLSFALQMQVLCIQGFLTCRKHAERIILLVEMLQV
jgi:phosphatidylinositol 4-kinase